MASFLFYRILHIFHSDFLYMLQTYLIVYAVIFGSVGFHLSVCMFVPQLVPGDINASILAL